MAVSFTEIFSSLCQTEKISAERRIVCEVAKIQPFERRLKRILFDELLGTKLFPRCVVKMARGLKMTPYEKALAFVYDLRSKRCYDRANQLEAALEFLTGDCANVLTETDSVLTFLLSLAETSGLCDQSTCKLMFDYTKLYKECVVVPDGELFDSDTTVEHSGSTVPYLMYSDELFDSLAMQYSTEKVEERHGLTEFSRVLCGNTVFYWTEKVLKLILFHDTDHSCTEASPGFPIATGRTSPFGFLRASSFADDINRATGGGRDPVAMDEQTSYKPLDVHWSCHRYLVQDCISSVIAAYRYYHNRGS
ncbi:uncharacterized protein LOC134182496 [Corticium candelabrum]|uniref:uncharacterized protein LOC134182496 n=1 Tax=Corticium candelabrum TaxID=121492 RepID=UPI002E25E6B8|nr:uncharacterized protein LOC134182496 [Corticium candelabrum]